MITIPRSARIHQENGTYHIMLRGINKQQIFEDEEDNQQFLQILQDCKEISKFRLYAYCLMGNHVHLLIQETNEPIGQIFRRIGSRYVFWYNAKYGRSGHLFQDRFKSELVTDIRYMLTVIRYIHQNPIKAGICNLPDQYRWSSYHEYSGQPVLIDRDEIEQFLPIQTILEESSQDTEDIGCMDIEDSVRNHLSDEQVRDIISETAGVRSVNEYQHLTRERQLELAAMLKKKGATIRQICRLTGMTYYNVQKL